MPTLPDHPSRACADRPPQRRPLRNLLLKAIAKDQIRYQPQAAALGLECQRRVAGERIRVLEYAGADQRIAVEVRPGRGQTWTAIGQTWTAVKTQTGTRLRPGQPSRSDLHRQIGTAIKTQTTSDRTSDRDLRPQAGTTIKTPTQTGTGIKPRR